MLAPVMIEELPRGFALLNEHGRGIIAVTGAPSAEQREHWLSSWPEYATELHEAIERHFPSAKEVNRDG